MEAWKNEYENWLNDTYMKDDPSKKRKTSHTMTEKKVKNAIMFLKNGTFPEDMDAQQRHNFKHKVLVEKKYSWVTVPAAGNMEEETVLTYPTEGVNGSLVVLPLEKFFATLKAIHENLGHARITTMWKKVHSQYYAVPKAAVVKFLEGCIGCQCRARQVNQAEPQIIVASDVFSRVQVDLIDQSMKATAGYKYILHLEDHFSKFHMLEPLKKKSIQEVNSALTRIFGTIGLPNIVQTDNGAEFFGLNEIFTGWPGGSDVRIIHGRPRHPESQGLVERGHQLVQERLAIAESEWLAENDTPFPWHERLPIIQYQVNCSHSTVIDSSPYKIVFGREPRGPPLFGRDGLVIEDGVADENDHSCSTAYDLDESNQTDSVPFQGADSWDPTEDQTDSVPNTETSDSGLPNEQMDGVPVSRTETSYPGSVDLLVDICNKKFPSWRMNYYKPNGRNDFGLGLRSGLTMASENVSIKLRQFVRQQLPGAISNGIADYVLFPELIIRLMVMSWGITKVEAEFYIHQLSAAVRQQC